MQKNQDLSEIAPASWKWFYAIAMSLMFIVLYGLSNYHASTLSHHLVLQYEWEKHIPVIQWFVIPYMSIDLFFFCSFFLCKSRPELHTHAARLALATLTATIIFLLFPMKLAADRPVLDGFNGVVYEFLKSFDFPHNLCPSLHVAYTLILRVLYGRHTRGMLWILFHLWFTAVSFSVLFVHQHHVVDLVGGGVLATLVMYFVPSMERARSLPSFHEVSPRPALSFWYGAGAVILAEIVWVLPELWVLAWPAFALIMLAAAYAGVGPRVFRKYKGRIPLNARAIYLPYFLGLHFSRWLCNRHAPPWSEVHPNLLIGRLLNDAEAGQLRDMGCHAVLDLTAEHRESSVLLEMNYLNVPILDLTEPTDKQLDAAAEFIRRHIGQGKVFVHCALGVGRSRKVAEYFLFSSDRSQIIK